MLIIECLLNLTSKQGDATCAFLHAKFPEDEIAHVARGKKFLEKNDEESNEFWDYYISLLPENITPNRAKGIVFDRQGREKAGLDPNFINKLESFEDDFRITKRKQWKN